MEKVPQKRKMKTADQISSDDLAKMDKNELVERIRQLEAHNQQLKNIIIRNNGRESEPSTKRKKPFDFSKSHFRKVLLRILYFGWDYKGLVVQEDSNQTVENHLFYALKKSCLIEEREKSDYHRCGRTDKGVSAFGQVISLRLRSKFPPDEQNSSTEAEIQYCKILNRLLPDDIKAVAWIPLDGDKEYSARFDCKGRLYRYYFPRSNLNIEDMRSACKYIVGSHDFRNLCRMDVGNGVTEFIRHILKADIIGDTEDQSPMTMCYLEIEGNAFLWHQIRCIFGVLMLIGQGKENPEVMKELLDVEQNPRKPQYFMALDVPLNLFRCSYDIENERGWVYDLDELRYLITHLQNYWTIHSVKTTMIKDCLNSLEDIFAKEKKETDNLNHSSEGESIMCHTNCLVEGVKTRVYKPLLEREKCSSLEERIEHYKKRRKAPEPMIE